MTMPYTSDPVTWKVTNQVRKDQYNPGSAPVPGYEIFYETGTGIKGSVWVSMADYMNTAKVKAAIGEQAAQAHEIGNLTSGQA